MSALSPPGRDVLAVTVGVGGVRARRTGTTDAADSFVEVPDASVDPGGPADAAALVAAVAGLTARGGHPPEAVSWAVHPGWRGGPAADLLAAVRAVGADRAVVVDEGYAAHVGAFGGVLPGICLSLGATASALVTDLGDRWHLLDGWPVPLGGRGSGAWIGAQGLAAALRHRDGVPDGSGRLLAAARAEFGDEQGWPALLAEQGDVVLTRFAPVVCEVAVEDALARAVVTAAGECLADLVVSARAILPDGPVVAVGGLLYLDGVRVALASALGRRRLFVMPALGGALEGARLVGEHLLAGGVLAHRPPYVVLGEQGRLPS
ncbi:hypothetical protein SAMN05421595_2243 [Austwickia chelonae]|uniref:ATPase BadF/BadG/BcrA/BcrD type domain-containing protein n=1 Tax=Austwickia chelonae NBRC 105200 TaxID=1184607 RepID=K6UN09_9MICO|nr:hypothetical protein [Austwickia chelonae]GAB78591.1 hypothetical protein AUCHE_16_00060 [Austwickia chelonae NBRC 105200]SEW33978.1 hypothetical protein SAMN05421595_2243 [Austwickia chelonae]